MDVKGKTADCVCVWPSEAADGVEKEQKMFLHVVFQSSPTFTFKEFTKGKKDLQKARVQVSFQAEQLCLFPILQEIVISQLEVFHEQRTTKKN